MLTPGERERRAGVPASCCNSERRLRGRLSLQLALSRPGTQAAQDCTLPLGTTSVRESRSDGHFLDPAQQALNEGGCGVTPTIPMLPPPQRPGFAAGSEVLSSSRLAGGHRVFT